MKDHKPHVTHTLRQAINPDALEALVRSAGAKDILPESLPVLREAAAATISARLAKTSRTRPDFALPAPPITPQLLEQARHAIHGPDVERAVSQAGFNPATPGALRPELVHQALAIELGSIARQAVQFARAEGRPLCATCVAVGAARTAEEGPGYLHMFTGPMAIAVEG